MTALQLPYRRGAPTKVGQRVYRKQLLPLNQSITYDGKPLNFTADYLSKLAQSFSDGAYDSVPFLLADPQNNHHMDPERFRGEVKGLDLAADGLYATVELTPEGAELVAKHPKLGVSASIVPDLVQADGRKFPLALRHVLGTLDPKVTGMGPWTPAELSNLGEVVDLTAARFSDEGENMPDLNPDVIEWLNGLSPEDRSKLLPTNGNGGPPAGDPAGNDPGADEFDEDMERLIAEELERAGIDPESGEEFVPATAGADESALSAEEREAIELANARAEQTATELAVVQMQLAEAKADKERHEWLQKGVEPWKVDLAVPYLVADGSEAIELSNGQTMSAAGVGEIFRKFLAADAGRIDLSGPTPSVRPDDSPESQREDVLKRWSAQHPLPGERAIQQHQAALKARAGGNG